MKEIRKCKVDGCNSEYYAKGYCNKHYHHIAKYGKIITNITRRKYSECIVEGCHGKPVAKGYCSKHIQQIRAHGEIRKDRERYKTYDKNLLNTETIDYDDIDIISLYEEVLSGNMSRFPKGIWMRPDAIMNAKKIARYVILNKMKIKPDDIEAISNLIIDDFVKYKCRGVLNIKGIRNKRDFIRSCFPELDFTPLDICKVDGCESTVHVNGYCVRHALQMYNHGRIRDDSEIIKPKKICNIDGCSNKAIARGLCSKHYQKFVVRATK